MYRRGPKTIAVGCFREHFAERFREYIPVRVDFAYSFFKLAFDKNTI